MATVGTLLINLGLGTAGLTSGLAGAETELKAFSSRVNGVAMVEAQKGANAQLAKAQLMAAEAANAEALATDALTKASASATISANELTAAQLRLQRASMATAESQQVLAAAQANAAAPKLSAVGKSSGLIAVGMTLATIAVVEWGAKSVEAASHFQQSMMLLHTQTGVAKQDIAGLSDAVLNMAPSVMTGPEELAKGLFHLTSVGLRGKEALDVLAIAAEGARVGMADLEDVSNALVAVVMSGIDPTRNWARDMGILNAIVGTGNLRMQDLAGSLSSGVLSTAKQFGLSMLDVGGALATMADQGIPAEEAATRLRISIALIAAPTKIASKELASIGLTQRSLADEMRGSGGLIGALTLLKERMDKAGLDAVQQSMLLKTAFGGSRSSAGILTLMNSLDLMHMKLNAIQEGAGSFGEAWAEQSSTAEANFQRLGATADVLKIRFGNGLLPVVMAVADAVTFLSDKTTIMVPLFEVLTFLIGALAVKAVGLLALSFWGMVKPLGAIIAQLIIASPLFGGLGAGITVSTGAAAAAAGPLAAAGAAAGGAGAAAAGAIPGWAGAAGAMAATATTTGPLVAGFAAVDGAMAATTGSTAPLLLGFSGLDGVMVATAGSTEPLVTSLAGVSAALTGTAMSTGPVLLGLAGVDGAMLATAAATTPILLGFFGLDGVMLSTAAATTPLLGGLAALNGSILSTAGSAVPLIESMAGVDGQMLLTAGTMGAVGDAAAVATPEVIAFGGGMSVIVPAALGAAGAAGAAAAGIGAQGAAAAVASPPMWTLAAATTAVALPMYVVVGVVAIVVGALIFLALNLDKVTALLKAQAAQWLTTIDVILMVAAALPNASQQVKDAHDTIHKAITDLQTQSDAVLKSGGPSFDLGIEDAVNAEIAKAKAQAQSSFTDLNATLIQLWGTSLAGVEGAAETAGAADMTAYAKGIRDAQQAPVDAFKEMLDSQKNVLQPQEEIARLVGMLQSKELAQGLADARPAVAAAAIATQKSIIAALDDKTGGAYSAGQMDASQWLSGWMDEQSKAGASGNDIFMRMQAMTPAGFADVKKTFEEQQSEWKNDWLPTVGRVADAMTKLRASLADGSTDIKTAIDAMITAFGNDASGMRQAGANGGSELMLGVADGIKKGRDDVLTELTDLHSMLANQMSTTARIAFYYAALTSQEITQGLASGDPATVAQTQGTVDLIEKQLSVLSNGTYKVGTMAAQGLGDGFVDNAKTQAQRIAEAAHSMLNSTQYGPERMANPSSTPTRLGLNSSDLAAGKTDYQKWLDSLNTSTTNFAAQANSDLTTAFNEIKAKAMEYFDAVHSKTLQAIEDARNQKNAILDAKEALIQEPVTAAQKALDFQRRKIQEWRLRQAVATATDPSSYRDAVLALQDFLAQSHIDDMQSEVDLQKNKLDAQKKANDNHYSEQVKAENKRYEQQKKDFDRQLTALERFLKNHPAAWARTQEKVLALLASYGITYKTAGSKLGSDFVHGLEEQVAAAKKAGDALAAAANPGGTSVGGVGMSNSTTYGFESLANPVKNKYALGAWDLDSDQVATVHAHEMILRPDLAEKVRRALEGRGMDALPGLIAGGSSLQSGVPPAPLGSLSTGTLNAMTRALGRPEVARPEVRTASASLGTSEGVSGGKTTVVFQVGDETFGEIADVTMYKQQARSSRNSTVRVPGSRR